MNNKLLIKNLILLLSMNYLLLNCATTSMSVEDNKGLINTHYLKASMVYEKSSDKSPLEQPFILLKLKTPSVVPEGSKGNQLLVSFVVEESSKYSKDQAYYDKESIYLTFNIETSSNENKTLSLIGIVYNHCDSPCSSLINSVQDGNGNSLYNFKTQKMTSFIIKSSIVKADTDIADATSLSEEFTIKIGVDPSRIGESWLIRQGYLGESLNLTLLLQPYYRQSIII